MKKNAVIRKMVVIITFIFMAAYYLKINPMYLFDTDDWLTVLPSRDIWPILGGWNPTRALPEVLHPILTYMAYIFIQPFTNNIVVAASYVYGVFTAILVVIFVIRLTDFTCNKGNRFWIGTFLLFFSSLLILFDNGKENTTFVFASWNVTCVFYYLIPNLLNMLLVLTLIELNTGDDRQVGLNSWKIGLLIVYIYMCINSNLYTNVLPVIYAFICIVKFVYSKIKNKKREVISTPYIIYIDIFIMILWIVTLIFERSGGRANQIGNNEWISAIPNAIKNIFNILISINVYIRVFFMLLLLYGIIIAIRNKNKEWKVYIELIVMELFTIIYYVLLDSKTGIHTSEGSTSLSLVFFLILAFAYSLKLIINNEVRSNYLALVTPFVICLVLSIFAKDFRNIRPMNIYGINSRTCLNIVNDMFEQMQEKSVDSDIVEIHVPSFYSDDNFPLAEYGADRFAKAYYTFSNAAYYKECIFVVDENKNDEFGIN